MAKVTKEELLDLALLAKLQLKDEELDSLTEAMSSIVAFADTINQAEAGMAGVENITGLQNAYREDTVIPSLPQEEILENVNGGEDGFFPVRMKA